MKILRFEFAANVLTGDRYADIIYRSWFRRRRIHVYANPVMVVNVPLQFQQPEKP
jgi:hypothetical protein